MTTQHTPGPWQVKHAGGGLVIGPANNAGGYHVTLASGPSAQAVADASLIAAAPELLEAVEALSLAVQALRNGKRDGVTMGNISAADDLARAVIKKAKGE